MNSRVLTAMDIGSTKIATSIGVTNSNSFEIVESISTPSQGIAKGIIKDSEKLIISIEKNLEEAERISGKKVEEVFLGISSRKVRLSEKTVYVNLKEGKVGKSDIKRAIEKGKRGVVISSNEEVIDVVINYYKVDDKVNKESVLGWIGKVLELNLTVILGEREEIEKYREVFKRVGKKIQGITINSLESRHTFLYGKRENGGRALVDIGGGLIDISIYKDGIVKYINHITVGGNNITNDISICANLPKLEAEKVKVINSSLCETIMDEEEKEIKIGANIISKKLFYDICKARIEEILKLIQNELKKYSQYEGLCSIILYGDGVNYFENIKTIVRDNFDKKVTIVTKDSLGLQNTSNITSISLVKGAYDRVKLEYTLHREEEHNKSKVDVIEKKKEIEGIIVEDNPGSFKKVSDNIKKFLQQIF